MAKFRKGQKRPPRAGRKKGSKNKRTKAREAEIAASGLTPREFLLSLMRNTRKDLATRIQAAVAVAPYVHQRLAATTIETPPGRPLETRSLPAADNIGTYLARVAAKEADRAAHTATRPARDLGEPGEQDDGGGEGPLPD